MEEGTQPRGWEGARRIPTDLIKGDFFRVPVLNIEEHDHSAILVPTGEDTRVASLDSAADSLQGQAVKELWVLQPEVHIAWQRGSRRGPSVSQPILGWHMVGTQRPRLLPGFSTYMLCVTQQDTQPFCAPYYLFKK